MPNNHFSRKERQLKNHILKLEKLINSNNCFRNSKIQNLIFKIKELVNILKDILSSKKLKYILDHLHFYLG